MGLFQAAALAAVLLALEPLAAKADGAALRNRAARAAGRALQAPPLALDSLAAADSAASAPHPALAEHLGLERQEAVPPSGKAPISWLRRYSRRVRHGAGVLVWRGERLLGRVPAAQPVSKEEEELDGEDMLVAVISTLLSVGTWLGLVTAGACIYRHRFMTPPVDLEKAQETFKGQGFMHNPFSCHEDMEVLCWSFWCSGVRWADNMHAVDALTFWIALLLFMGAGVLDMFTGGVIMWILIAVLFTYYRQELRKKLGMKNDGEDALKDFGLWCCCACCAIAQEARHIKAAPKQEHAAVLRP